MSRRATASNRHRACARCGVRACAGWCQRDGGGAPAHRHLRRTRAAPCPPSAARSGPRPGPRSSSSRREKHPRPAATRGGRGGRSRVAVRGAGGRCRGGAARVHTAWHRVWHARGSVEGEAAPSSRRETTSKRHEACARCGVRACAGWCQRDGGRAPAHRHLRRTRVAPCPPSAARSGPRPGPRSSSSRREKHPRPAATRGGRGGRSRVAVRGAGGRCRGGAARVHTAWHRVWHARGSVEGEAAPSSRRETTSKRHEACARCGVRACAGWCQRDGGRAPARRRDQRTAPAPCLQRGPLERRRDDDRCAPVRDALKLALDEDDGRHTLATTYSFNT